jgi:pimeloyl-ACP methyl ester carboxylesterase
MDAAGLEHAAILGYSEGGPPASLFAATYPKRCDALVLAETGAKFVADDGYLPDARAKLDHVWKLQLAATDEWGQGKLFALWSPSLEGGPVTGRRWGARSGSARVPAWRGPSCARPR